MLILKYFNNIRQKLEVGKIYIHKNTVTLRISKYKELQKLLNIFDIKPLNTTKYLNYIAFKEALLLYNKNTQSTKLFSPLALNRKICTPHACYCWRELDKIRVLKNSMNTLRTVALMGGACLT